MSRHTQFENLYDIYNQFKTRCLLSDHSFFLPDQEIWTLKNITSLKTRLVDNPEQGDENFDAKLNIQMHDASPAEWVILAEAHLIYYLPPKNTTLEKRRDTVLGYLKNAGNLLMQMPPKEFWQSIKGFSRVGLQYNLRYRHLWLILMLAEVVKNAPDRVALLNDPQRMRVVLDTALENLTPRDRAHDMRHALLYLNFPDTHEPILSNSHREQIIKFYGERLGIAEPDPDLALQQIHTRVAAEEGLAETDMNFYSDTIKAAWQGKTVAPPIATETTSEDVITAVETSTAHDPEVTQALKKLGFTKNLIFTGAPGTGKTYTAQRVARALVGAQVKETLTVTSKHELPLNILENLTRYEVIALALYDQPVQARFANSDVLKLPLVRQFENLRDIKVPLSAIGTQLGEHTKPGNSYSNLAFTRQPYIFDKDAHGWFLNDEGRLYVEQELADYLEMMRQPSNAQGRFEDYIQTVAFHPSYAYEDFVEGMRPVVDGAGNLSYEIRPGILRVMCSRAAADPDNRYVLIIDEINRANLSKVFGELITLIEDDKRLGTVNMITVKLPYSGDTFGVPNNLYFIGTLNTADRSIALMDVAMRRRFAFVEVPPRPELLGELTDRAGNILNLAAVLTALNDRIRQHMGRACEIGHSYLINITRLDQESQTDALDHVWNTQLLPILEEYFYSRPDTLKDVLKEFNLEEYDSSERLGFAEGDDLMIALLRMSQN